MTDQQTTGAIAEKADAPAEPAPEAGRDAAERLARGYGLEAGDAEPMAGAAARLLRESTGFADHVAAALSASGDAPRPEMREAFCAKVAWGVYAQSMSTGGIEGVDRGLNEGDFEDRPKRDKVAAEVMRHLSWRKGILEADPDKPVARVLTEGFDLADPGAERLCGAFARMLALDEAFASSALDMARQEREISPACREGFIARFAAAIYHRSGGKLGAVPGNLRADAFQKQWIRNLVASALEDRIAAATAPKPQSAPGV